MEENERDHIEANLPELLRLTKCTTIVLAEFRRAGILTSDEIQIVDSKVTDSEQANAFYNIIVTRKNSYVLLERILSIEGQSGAALILRRKPGFFRPSLSFDNNSLQNPMSQPSSKSLTKKKKKSSSAAFNVFLKDMLKLPPEDRSGNGYQYYRN